MGDFVTNLKNELKQRGFSDEQVNVAIEATVLISQKEVEKSKKPTDDNAMLFSLISGLVSDKSFMERLFKPNLWKLGFDFAVTFLLVGSLVFLAWKQILGTCETATILGGIVGYLLGNARK